MAQEAAQPGKEEVTVASKRKIERRKKRWDDHLAQVAKRPLCPYCNDTGKAPDSDGRTPCGLCS